MLKTAIIIIDQIKTAWKRVMLQPLACLVIRPKNRLIGVVLTQVRKSHLTSVYSYGSPSWSAFTMLFNCESENILGKQSAIIYLICSNLLLRSLSPIFALSRQFSLVAAHCRLCRLSPLFAAPLPLIAVHCRLSPPISAVCRPITAHRAHRS